MLFISIKKITIFKCYEKKTVRIAKEHLQFELFSKVWISLFKVYSVVN